MSAPANMAFPGSSVHLQNEMDFDISPITSPWLGAHQQSTTSPLTRNLPATGKRAASPSTDSLFGEPASKRQSPAIQPISSTSTAAGTTTSSARRHSRANRSQLATPSMSRKDSAQGDAVADTPSPVESFMLPPAPPATQSSSAPSASTSMDHFPGNPQSGGLTPVTPSTIMNLGRLGVNKLPSLVTSSKVDSKSSARPKTTQDTNHGRASKKVSSSSATSPNLKAILPGRSLHLLFSHTLNTSPYHSNK